MLGFLFNQSIRCVRGNYIQTNILLQPNSKFICVLTFKHSLLFNARRFFDCFPFGCYMLQLEGKHLNTCTEVLALYYYGDINGKL